MQLDELSGEGQPESRPLDFLVGRAHLPELLEDRLLILGGDAHTVSATEISAMPSFIGAHTSIRPPSGGERDRVCKQVQQDLLDLPLIGPNLAEALIDVPLEREPAAILTTGRPWLSRPVARASTLSARRPLLWRLTRPAPRRHRTRRPRRRSSRPGDAWPHRSDIGAGGSGTPPGPWAKSSGEIAGC